MASTYTSNNGIEKIGSGEQAGTWGTTTNNNLDIIDRAINGVASISISGTTHDLTTTDGTLSDGGFKVLVFTGALGANNTVTIGPNDQDKVYLVKNSTTDSGSSGPYSVILSQGSGGNATITNGEIAWVFADGAGSSAAVTKQDISSSPTTFTVGTDLTVTGDASIGDDLSLASDSAVLKFGADSEITLSHVHDSGLTLKHAASGDDKFATISLAAGDNDIAVNDKLGVINFIAPDEGAGTDAITVGAGIEAISEGDFSSSVNTTKLSFKTATSGAATEKMALSSAGNLTVTGKLTLGNQLIMPSNADTRILIADGSEYQERAVSGDITISNTGVVTIANNAVETAMIADGQVSAAKLTSGTGVCNASCTVNNFGSTVSISSNNTNIAGHVDNGTGDISVTFSNHMSGTDYAALVSAIDNDGTNRNIGETIVEARSTSATQIKTYRPSASENSARSVFDNDMIAFAAFD